MSKKTSEELAINNLKIRFGVAYGGPAAFIAALKDGTIRTMITDCANAMYGGDPTVVIQQLIKNCQDKQCRRKNLDVVNSMQRNGAIMEDAFLEYLQDLKKEFGIGKNTESPIKNDKVGHTWSLEDIAAIEEHETARRLYNRLASTISKRYGSDLSLLDDEQKTERAKLLVLRNAARDKAAALKGKPVKAAPVEPNISDELRKKLTGDGKATLSSKQVEELKKLLGL